MSATTTQTTPNVDAPYECNVCRGPVQALVRGLLWCGNHYSVRTGKTTTDYFGVFTGYGPTRRTRKSAQREADIWNASGDGNRYAHPGRTNVIPHVPPHFETCVAEVQPTDDGGFRCAYVTTREPIGSDR